MFHGLARHRTISGITDVAERQLCTGCGACAYAQPDVIQMVDDIDEGRRPLVRSVSGSYLPTVQALAACPGIGLAHDAPVPEAIPELRDAWGPVLAMWEGYATDEDLRWAGSSGGVATALALYAMQSRGMHGLLHIRARQDASWLNETVLSVNRREVLQATGSRYAPASPCDRLDLVASAPAPCVFIGKPCDVAATSKLRATDALLDEKLGLTIAIFCAGTPSTRGTLAMLEKMGIDDPAKVVSLRYRGNGWPGDAVAKVRNEDGSTSTRHLTYDESWGDILQRHRQWRCYVCADHTGEFADVAVGDPWYRTIDPGESGHSLILARTERGRAIIEGALQSGIIRASTVDSSILPASQPGLKKVRGAVGGRIFTLRLLGLPVPKYEGLPTWRSWWRELSSRDKLRSTLGTLRRIRRRQLHRRRPVEPIASPTATMPGSGQDPKTRTPRSPE